MVFEAKLAFRYLVSARLQTGLLVIGVAVGVLVFTFIAALMNGLGVRLTQNITGTLAHVTLEPIPREPRMFWRPANRALYAMQPGHDVAPVVRMDRTVVEIARHMEGVRIAVPQVVGNATLARGEKLVAVTVTGVAPGQAGAIAPIDRSIVKGELDLGIGSVVIGSRLASNLAVNIGDRLVLRASRAPGAAPSADVVVTIRGVFTIGVEAVDERVIYLELESTKKLFAMADGVSSIEIKVDDVWEAPTIALRLSRATHLKATSWLERNANLESGLRAQASSGAMIKAFSLLTIAIGVASALFLAVSRRRAEIGIMRSFGIGRRTIVRTFVLQGLLIGVAGSLVGVALGFGFAHALLALSARATGTASIPIDPALGEYLRAIVLGSLASGIAAVLPAWSAARIDPLEAIQA